MIVLTEGFLWLIRFMIGACIFSFLNVVADRLPREESVVRGRSHCTVCGRTLGPLELIPCVSFLALRGKCKGCKQPFRNDVFYLNVWVERHLYAAE